MNHFIMCQYSRVQKNNGQIRANYIYYVLNAEHARELQRGAATLKVIVGLFHVGLEICI